MGTHIRFEETENTAYITFYEEEERKPCTLDWDVLAELDEIITNLELHQPSYKSVVIQSASPKSFIVGANIAVLKTQNASNIGDWVANGHRIFNRLQTLPVPVIAKVGKYALGGGLELAMACDMIIAGENARFGQPEASLGVMPGWGGSYRLPMLVGPNRAKEIFMTGRQLDAKTAYEWGLVNRVCPESELDVCVSELVSQISNNSSEVLGLVKQIIFDETQRGVYHNCFIEAATSANCMASEDTQRRLSGFFESRKK
ncbi:enoyl-CoA hydratase/isomerase family protein [Clostridium sp. Marseille-P2415]|uniref:enoyl-CoA hydratase/isomerase family protein n=1 Tax=Clostridium sp. Marseille-P2415 TaxID=1805471 RepID=UPI0013563115|nr:enoyl-CoA hydratase/isomerase family protein [Clostridium sp. Marseille-P2415]